MKNVCVSAAAALCVCAPLAARAQSFGVTFGGGDASVSVGDYSGAGATVSSGSSSQGSSSGADVTGFSYYSIGNERGEWSIDPAKDGFTFGNPVPSYEQPHLDWPQYRRGDEWIVGCSWCSTSPNPGAPIFGPLPAPTITLTSISDPLEFVSTSAPSPKSPEISSRRCLQLNWKEERSCYVCTKYTEIEHSLEETDVDLNEGCLAFGIGLAAVESATEDTLEGSGIDWRDIDLSSFGGTITPIGEEDMTDSSNNTDTDTDETAYPALTRID